MGKADHAQHLIQRGLPAKKHGADQIRDQRPQKPGYKSPDQRAEKAIQETAAADTACQAASKC